jgi:hypothetical protein
MSAPSARDACSPMIAASDFVVNASHQRRFPGDRQLQCFALSNIEAHVPGPLAKTPKLTTQTRGLDRLPHLTGNRVSLFSPFHVEAHITRDPDNHAVHLSESRSHDNEESGWNVWPRGMRCRSPTKGRQDSHPFSVYYESGWRLRICDKMAAKMAYLPST